MKLVVAYLVVLGVSFVVEQIVGILLLLVLGTTVEFVFRNGPPEIVHRVVSCAMDAGAGFAMVGAARIVFDLFGERLTVLGVMILLTIYLIRDVRRLSVFFRVWGARMSELGYDAQSPHPESGLRDVEANMRYNNIGDELAHIGGRIAGFVGGTVVFVL